GALGGNNPMAKANTTFSKAYADFAAAFQAGDFGRLRDEFSKSLDVFERSRNTGLAKQCYARLARQKILDLNSTYITLPLADIAREVAVFGAGRGGGGVEEVEREVLRLIEDGEVLATISHENNGMVSFQDPTERYDSEATMIALGQDLRAAMALARRVQKLDESVQLSRSYQTKLARDSGTGGGAGGGGGGPRGSDRFMSSERFGSAFSFDDEVMVDE
ncbi:COP9 signalosome complex subunit 3, partial [Cladochytrium tenue]